MAYDHIYRWGNNPVRKSLKGKPCAVIARGRMRSVLIETEDGRRYVTSARAVMRR